MMRDLRRAERSEVVHSVADCLSNVGLACGHDLLYVLSQNLKVERLLEMQVYP